MVSPLAAVQQHASGSLGSTEFLIRRARNGVQTLGMVFVRCVSVSAGRGMGQGGERDGTCMLQRRFTAGVGKIDVAEKQAGPTEASHDSNFWVVIYQDGTLKKRDSRVCLLHFGMPGGRRGKEAVRCQGRWTKTAAEAPPPPLHPPSARLGCEGGGYLLWLRSDERDVPLTSRRTVVQARHYDSGIFFPVSRLFCCCSPVE